MSLLVRPLLFSDRMDPRELMDIACTGAMLAVVLRWFLRLDVELHWAVCIGAVSLLLDPWLNLHLGPTIAAESPMDLAMGAVIAMAFLGIAQILRA